MVNSEWGLSGSWAAIVQILVNNGMEPWRQQNSADHGPNTARSPSAILYLNRLEERARDPRGPAEGKFEHKGAIR